LRRQRFEQQSEFELQAPPVGSQIWGQSIPSAASVSPSQSVSIESEHRPASVDGGAPQSLAQSQEVSEPLQAPSPQKGSGGGGPQSCSQE